jgi:hypothetical protein
VREDLLEVITKINKFCSREKLARILSLTWGLMTITLNSSRIQNEFTIILADEKGKTTTHPCQRVCEMDFMSWLDRKRSKKHLKIGK